MNASRVLLWLLLGTVASSYGLLFTLGDAVQAKYSPAREISEASPMRRLGDKAPADLLRALRGHPSCVIIFPSCRSCTLEQPSALAGQPFRGPVVVVLPDATDAELCELRKLDPKMTFLSSRATVAEEFGIFATPRVVRISAACTITYLQPEYVPAGNLWMVVNGG